MRWNGSRIAGWVSAIALATTSCSGMVAYRRGYVGAVLPRDQVALVANVGAARIWQVDEGPAETTAGVAQVVELTPGRHTLCVTYSRSHGSGVTASRGCQPLQLDAAAGRTYAIYAVVASDRWQPAVWDVTDELDARELAPLAKRVIEAANRDRPESAKLAQPEIRRTQPLQGFGEKRTARIHGWREREVEVEYSFDRYQPFVQSARSSDGTAYLLEVSQKTGGVARVVGRYIDCKVGPLIELPLLQLAGSEVAAGGWLMCKEGPPDRFTQIENPNRMEIQVPMRSPWPSMP